MPFADRWRLQDHFKKHGWKLGAANAAEYERMADEFVFGIRVFPTEECNRQQGDRVRYRSSDRHFGVGMPATSTLRTFYAVDPAVITSAGGHRDFLRSQCDRLFS